MLKSNIQQRRTSARVKNIIRRRAPSVEFETQIKLHDSVRKHEHGGFGHIIGGGHNIIIITFIYIIFIITYILYNCCAFSVTTKCNRYYKN